jgi:hypothetical protein
LEDDVGMVGGWSKWRTTRSRAIQRHVINALFEMATSAGVGRRQR